MNLRRRSEITPSHILVELLIVGNRLVFVDANHDAKLARFLENESKLILEVLGATQKTKINRQDSSPSSKVKTN